MAADKASEKDLWERAAGFGLEVALGNGYSFRHTGSDTADKDGVVDFNGVPHFAVEVTRCSKEDELQFHATLNRGESGPLLELDAGSGAWIAALSLGTRLKKQSRQVFQPLVDALNERGWSEFEPGLRPNQDALIALCQPLGVTSIRRYVGVQDTGRADYIYRHLEIDYKNSFLDPSSDLVAGEIQDLLNTEWLRRKIANLVARSEGLPAHLVLVAGDKLSNSAQFTMRGIRPNFDLPTADIQLPADLDTVWLISLDGLAMSFQRSLGWSVHDTTAFIRRWNSGNR
ncbi:MAG TPA: hypothetical protein VIJ86_02165 [Acidimicrobiales bacterium]